MRANISFKLLFEFKILFNEKLYEGNLVDSYQN